jgi:3'-phosphoadenosine 5'-phosphosulfate sulfotransferase (PAPS reductase)/FAD synthetase
LSCGWSPADFQLFLRIGCFPSPAAIEGLAKSQKRPESAQLEGFAKPAFEPIDGFTGAATPADLPLLAQCATFAMPRMWTNCRRALQEDFVW